MNAWTYYSPLWLGFLLTFLAHDLVREAVPRVGTLDGGAYWGVVAAAGVVVALCAQLGLIGFQGLAAKALPVPPGRTVRGPAAALIGGLLVAGMALGWLAPLLLSQGIALMGWAAGIGAGACLVAAGVWYGWNWPSAAPDFGRE